MGEYDNKYFSVKERSPFKEDFPIEKLKVTAELNFMANLWARVLATRHKRASYLLNNNTHLFTEAFSRKIDGRQNEFINLVTSIAFQYADCVAQDCDFLREIAK